MVAGLAFGLLIGVISGTVFLLLLKTALSTSGRGLSSILTLTGELLAIPTFWFGGPWLSGKLLTSVHIEEIFNPYVSSLAVTFTLIAAYPAFRWIIQLGEDFGGGRV